MAVFAVAASTALGVFDTEISEQEKDVNVSKLLFKEIKSGSYSCLCRAECRSGHIPLHCER